MPRFYWDFSQAKSYLERKQTPWTPAVSVVFGLYVSLDMMLKEGLKNIVARHARVGAAAREGVKSLGLPLFAEEGYASNTVTSVAGSDGLDVKKMLTIMVPARLFKEKMLSLESILSTHTCVSSFLTAKIFGLCKKERIQGVNIKEVKKLAKIPSPEA